MERNVAGARSVAASSAGGQRAAGCELGPLPSGRLGGHPPVSSQWPPPRQRWEPPAPFIGNLGNRCQDSTWTLGSTFQLHCDFGAAVSSLGALSSRPGSRGSAPAPPSRGATTRPGGQGACCVFPADRAEARAPSSSGFGLVKIGIPGRGWCPGTPFQALETLMRLAHNSGEVTLRWRQ